VRGVHYDNLTVATVGRPLTTASPCRSLTLTDRRRCCKRESSRVGLDNARCMSGEHLFALTRPFVHGFSMDESVVSASSDGEQSSERRRLGTGRRSLSVHAMQRVLDTLNPAYLRSVYRDDRCCVTAAPTVKRSSYFTDQPRPALPGWKLFGRERRDGKR